MLFEYSSKVHRAENVTFLHALIVKFDAIFESSSANALLGSEGSGLH
jgi:hypothetical protein